MFAHRFFARSFFAPRYFAPVPMVVVPGGTVVRRPQFGRAGRRGPSEY
jgi:hypothetical protein